MSANSNMEPRDRPHGGGPMMSSKKKFGKNLNKLTKPPSQPLPSTSSSNRTGSDRNGLLLLSTKRGGNASGGILAGNKFNSVSSNGNGQEALSLGVSGPVTLQDGNNTEQNQPVDAWGVSTNGNGAPPAPAISDVHKTKLSNEGPSTHGKKKQEQNTNLSSDDVKPGVAAKRKDQNIDIDTSDGRGPVTHERAGPENERDSMSGNPTTIAFKTSDSVYSRGSPVPSHIALQPLGRTKGTTNAINDPPRIISASSRSRVPEIKQRTPSDLYRPPNSLANADTPKQQRQNNTDNNDAVANNTRNTQETSHGRGEFSRNSDDQVPMIHLASYDDRDRGEQNKSAGPRMLFDPKSGSMVAAPARDEGQPKSSRKDRQKGKGRGRDKDKRDSKQSGGSGNQNGMPKERKSKGKKDESAKEKSRRGDPTDHTGVSDKSKKNKKKSEAIRLPRTCGVLYVRGESGSCVCADGVDGDQGYGSHSVPGGQLRNPGEHKKFLKMNDQEKAGAPEYQTTNTPQKHELNDNIDQNDIVSDSMATASLFGQSSSSPVQVDWVKPNEKIELMIGVSNSPTLQATANPWAPCATTPSIHKSNEDQSSTDEPPMFHNTQFYKEEEEDEEEEEEDTMQPFIGLGFDPTENMDSVVQSPSNLDKSIDIDNFVFGSLSLGEAAKGLEPSTQNIFGFGTPWGAGGKSKNVSRVLDWTPGALDEDNDESDLHHDFFAQQRPYAQDEVGTEMNATPLQQGEK
mmetsp:Transcript_21283/g.32756  ORF Transcript_21283/g.32756 Transcript_21283/m.32756 type:complete len:740 (-) Transcript_21283:720-2939(-)